MPLICSARGSGHWVAVADMDPAAAGIPFADAYVNASTIDAEAITRAAVEHRVEAVCTAATDQPLMAIARATAVCGLPGLSEETALRVTRKDLMRRALATGGVSCPASFPVRNEAELRAAFARISGPAIVKPADSSGSRGVTKVVRVDDLPGALAHALDFSRVKIGVVEAFLQGREFSVETLSLGGTLRVLQVTEKETSGPPHFVESGHAQPARLTPGERQGIEKIVAEAARALGIEDGPTHTEVMLTATGPFIVEVGARLGGDYITSDLVPLSTGIDMLGLVLEIALGNRPEIPEPLARGAAVRYFYPSRGSIRSIEGIAEAEAIPGVVRVECFRKPGQSIVPVTGSHERAGYVIARGDGVEAAVAAAEEARARVRFLVEPDH